MPIRRGSSRRRPGLSTQGQLVPGMSAANIREVVESPEFTAIDWTDQIVLTGNQTLDWSELNSKSIFIRPSGKPALITDASTAMIIGGQANGGNGDFSSNTYAPQFFGDLFILQSGSITDGTRGITIEPETYRLGFDRLWIKGFGGGLQCVKGEMRGLTINKWACWDFKAFGVELFSKDPIKEISEFIIVGEATGNTTTATDDGIHYSFGPSVGSAGKISAVIRNGVPYRQAYCSVAWDVIPITSMSWAADVLTIGLFKYHSVAEGDPVLIGGCSVSSINNVTGASTPALAGTTGKTLKIAHVGDPGTINPNYGYFTYNANIIPAAWNGFERPRKIHFENINSRGPRNGGHYIISGANISFRGCVVDDAGTSDPYAYNCTGTWAAVTVTGITQANPGVVTTAAAHPYSTGASVPIASVVGMTEVNDQSFTITKLTDTTFSIGVDTSAYTAYASGGTAGGTVTYKTWEADGVTPKAHTLVAGDYFNTRLGQPAGYNASLIASTVSDTSGVTNVVTAPMVVDPGAAATTHNCDFYVPETLDAHGWYYGERAGPPDIEGCVAHENYGAAVYDDRVTNQRGRIVNNDFFNSRYGFPDAPDPFKMGEIWCRPGRANMTITDNRFGANDTWRFGSKSFLFAGQPTAGDYVWLRLSASTEPTYFIFVSSDPTNDSSQPEVLIGADLTATIKNLRDAIHARDDANCNAVQATPTNASLDVSQSVVPDRLLIVRNVPGAIGKDYTIGESSTNISLSPAGASLSGGTGAATANYAVMNVPNGIRGNVVERNDMESHTDGETNTTAAETVAVIRPNLLDNADFSLDQRNEGAAVTISSSGATTGIPLVDRWYGNRSGTNITAQRVAGTSQTYALKLTGAAANTAAIVRQRHEGARAAQYVGKVMTLSALVSSPGVTKAALRLSYATALNDFTTDTNIGVHQYVIGTTPKRLSFTTLIPSGASNGLEASIRFTNGIGAAATVLIEELKLEESGVVTAFVPAPPEDTLFTARRYYRKSFPSGTAPAQNAGVTGAIVGVQSIAGATAQQFQTVEFNPPMWKAPTVTLYNPSAANAQIRNTTAGADWTLSTAASISETGMTINGTGPGGGAAGDASAIHYGAEAGLG